MSTFNGERFLRAQLDTLLEQDYCPTNLLIRDDGSTDQTVEIIKEYQLQFNNIRLIEGSNIGVVRSFFELFIAASPDAEYFALCDQDDLWSPAKISSAVSAIGVSDVPHLFVSSFHYIDSENTEFGTSPLPRKELGLRHALVQNRFPGCTMVLNRAALQLVTSQMPDLTRLRIHDWWIYLVVGVFGKVRFEPQPLISYRQHAMNTIGLKESRLDARFRRLLTNERYCTQQANLLKECFEGIMDGESWRILNRFISERTTLWECARYAITKDVYRQEVVNDLILRVLILLNRV